MIPEIAKLLKQKYNIETKILNLRSKCPHVDNVELEYGSNTGNYDPSADCYWIDVYCKDCGSFNKYFSDVPEYRKYSLLEMDTRRKNENEIGR